MVLVDTSVWIDFFRGGRSKEATLFSNFIAEEQDIAICGVIRQEILQGISDTVTLRRISGLLEKMYYLPCHEPLVFDEAAAIYRKARQKGITIRNAIDCLIAAIAIDSKIPILQRDKDFRYIAELTTLTLYQG